MQNNDRPILTTYSLRSLVIAVVCAVVVLVVHKDSLWTTTALLLFLLGPLTVYSFVIVKFYDDHIVIIRPLHVIHVKTTIHYCQIHYMRVPSKYLSMAVMDLLIYFKDQKRPMEIPLPYFSRDQQKLKRLIESKGIDFYGIN